MTSQFQLTPVIVPRSTMSRDIVERGTNYRSQFKTTAIKNEVRFDMTYALLQKTMSILMKKIKNRKSFVKIDFFILFVKTDLLFNLFRNNVISSK